MEASMAVLEARFKGCYSITYPDPSDCDWQFSIDFNWHPEPDAGKNQWTCAESPTGTIHWTLFKKVPDHAMQALLNHFGLTQDDVDMNAIVTMSPADLARVRRKKERVSGLVPKIMMNMRRGCPEGELADTFEAVP